MPRAASYALVAAVAFVVAGCASAPFAPLPALPLPADAPFTIDGRLSARRGNEAISVSFAWMHAAPRDEFVVTTPFGGRSPNSPATHRPNASRCAPPTAGTRWRATGPR